MKIKKLLAALTALTMAASFAACGGSKDPDDITEEEFESAAAELDDMSDEELEEIFDEPDEEAAEDTTAETTAETVEEEIIIEPTEEILEADMYSGKVQIANHVFQMPIKISDLIDAGAEFESKNGEKIEDIDKYFISSGESSRFYFYLDGVKCGGLFISNQSDTRITLRDYNKSICLLCLPRLVISERECQYEIDNVIFPGGLRNGSTREELEAAYGEPIEIDQGDKSCDIYNYCKADESSYRKVYNGANYLIRPEETNYVEAGYNVIIDLETDTISINRYGIADTSEEN